MKLNVKTLILAGSVLLGASPAAFAQSEASSDTLSMAIGTYFGHEMSITLERLKPYGIDVDREVFLKSFNEQLKGLPTGLTVEESGQILDNYMKRQSQSRGDSVSVESQRQFIDSLASLEGAVVYPDGLVMFVELEGEGAMPTDSDTVRVLYTGRLSDGTVFDATESPIDFKVSGLTPGFAEGLKMMKPGGRYRLVIPASLAYGPEGIPGVIPGNAALDFTVSLVGVVK